jgi:hypothetical protein
MRPTVAASRRALRKHLRTLACEPLERRELLAVALTGVQAVGLWNMAIANEVLSQEAAAFTLAGSSQQANQPVSVDWGDGSAVYQGTLDANAKASTTHAFRQGTFTVVVTCNGDVSRYTLQSNSMALGYAVNSGTPSTQLSLFMLGNGAAQQVVVAAAGDGMLRASITNPLDQRLVAHTIAGIYGSLPSGNDAVVIQPAVTQAAFFVLGDGNDSFSGGAGPDTVLGGKGNDIIHGGTGNNVIIGGSGNDWLYGGNGHGTDTIEGGSGNDYIFGGNGSEMLFAGSGNDTIYGGNGTDLIEGDGGNDRLYAGNGADYLYGGSGNSILKAGSGNDWLFGGAGNDQLYCGSGNDAVIAGTGTDRIYGGSGNDILAGGYSFLLYFRRSDTLDAILGAWAVQKEIPPQLADPNLALWDSGTSDLIVKGSGRTLIFAGQADKIVGAIRPGVDVKVASPVPTATDVAAIQYTTTSGIVNPSGTAGATTTILGRFGSDMNTIINQQLLYRKTIDFSAEPRGFQVLNVPDAFYITPDQFWTDYNQPFLAEAAARNDVILAATVPSPGGGYGREADFLAGLGYSYDPASHQFLRT